MTGIVGFLRRDQEQLEVNDLAILLNAIAFMGGDYQDLWVDASIGLGIQAKFLAPQEKNDRMPFHYETLTIVADVRLDNRVALCVQLDVPASEYNSIADSRLLALAYQKWGTQMAQHLYGDFAFAIWDARKKQLYLVRDHIGARPLFYYYNKQHFLFSSDLEALLSHPQTLIDVNYELIYNQLYHRLNFTYHRHFTYYRDFYRLGFAHELIVSAADFDCRPYWEPDTDTKIRLPDREAYFQKTRDLVEQAISDRLRTEYPIGSHLSGGIDSSSVTIYAARLLRQQGRELAHTYSWSPPGPSKPVISSEYYRLQKILEQEKLNIKYFAPYVARETLFRLEIRETLQEGERLVQPDAERRGIRLILSGWGGDEYISFAGRGYRAQLAKRLRLLDLLQTFDWSQFPRKYRTNLKILWRDVVMSSIPDWLYKRTPTGKHYLQEERFVYPEIMKEVRQLNEKTLRYQRPSIGMTQKMLYDMGHIAERMERWYLAGAFHQITYAYPLTDRRVMEFAFSVPEELYVYRNMRRYLYRQAMRPIFPDDITANQEINMKSEPGMLRHVAIVHKFTENKKYEEADRIALNASFDNPLLDIRRMIETYNNRDINESDMPICSAAEFRMILLWERIKELRAQKAK